MIDLEWYTEEQPRRGWTVVRVRLDGCSFEFRRNTPAEAADGMRRLSAAALVVAELVGSCASGHAAGWEGGS